MHCSVFYKFDHLIRCQELTKLAICIFVRLTSDLSEDIGDDPSGGKIKWEQGKIDGDRCDPYTP